MEGVTVEVRGGEEEREGVTRSRSASTLLRTFQLFNSRVDQEGGQDMGEGEEHDVKSGFVGSGG